MQWSNLSVTYSAVRSLLCPTPRRKAPSHKLRLQVEQMEQREVPATFTVNTMVDTPDANVGDGFARDANGKTSLRAAIMEANAAAGATTINYQAVPMPIQGTLTLETALPTLDKDISIDGPGINKLTIERDTNPNFNTDFVIFYISPGTNCNISGLTVSNGKADNGGGIKNFGTLGLSQVNVFENTATTSGGGIYNAGSMEISSSFISSNDAGQFGGGIYNGGALYVFSSTIQSNWSSDTGGGLDNGPSSSAYMYDTTFLENGAYNNGGGIYNNATLEMTAGGAILYNYVYGGTELGGGLFNASGTATLDSVDIEYNGATVGGGFFLLQGDLTLENCTLNHNSANIGIGGKVSSSNLNSLHIVGGNIVDPIDYT